MTADPTLAERLNARIALHLRGELQEAEGHYLAVLALEPTHAEAHKLLAVIALDRGELERAAALVSSALALQPQSGEFLHLLGRIRLRQGDFQDACRCLSRAVTFKAPELEQALVELSGCFAKLKAWPQSLSAALSALEREPNDVVAHRFAGHACFALDRHDEAVEHFRSSACERRRTACPMAPDFRQFEPAGTFCRGLRTIREGLRAGPGEHRVLVAAASHWSCGRAGLALQHGQRPITKRLFCRSDCGTGQNRAASLGNGTGSGLLAMLAARGEGGELRASEVVTCEANPLLAQTATRISTCSRLRQIFSASTWRIPIASPRKSEPFPWSRRVTDSAKV